MGEERDFKGVWIPKEIWLAKDITPMEKMLLAEIDSFSSKGECFASNKHFSELLNVSPNWCSEKIKSLQQKGWIEIEYEMDGKQYKKRYLKPCWGVFGIPKGGIRYSEEGYSEKPKGNNTSNTNTSNNTPYSPPQGEREESFNAFWSLYPRKVGKGAARKIWLRKNFPLEEIRKALQWQTKTEDWTKDNGVFIPYPATYLNAERWLDEPPVTETSAQELYKKYFEKP
jgi:DNA-binding Lrp family transcriptional regulator